MSDFPACPAWVTRKVNKALTAMCAPKVWRVVGMGVLTFQGAVVLAVLGALALALYAGCDDEGNCKNSIPFINE